MLAAVKDSDFLETNPPKGESVFTLVSQSACDDGQCENAEELMSECLCAHDTESVEVLAMQLRAQPSALRPGFEGVVEAKEKRGGVMASKDFCVDDFDSVEGIARQLMLQLRADPCALRSGFGGGESNRGGGMDAADDHVGNAVAYDTEAFGHVSGTSAGQRPGLQDALRSVLEALGEGASQHSFYSTFIGSPETDCPAPFGFDAALSLVFHLSLCRAVEQFLDLLNLRLKWRCFLSLYALLVENGK